MVILKLDPLCLYAQMSFNRYRFIFTACIILSCRIVVKKIRIATRKSALALWQAQYVRQQLEYHHRGVQVELVKLTSKGDQMLDAPLAKIGGKGLFVKELENALLEDRADIAVHSMKDVPMDLPKGLFLGAICHRRDPYDAFVSNEYKTVYELPPGAVIGTSSLRRQSQIMALRPDLRIEFLRGNVNTRLKKLDSGLYDAIILAAAGLMRLNMESRIQSRLTITESLPAAGQGAVCIECRHNDLCILDLLKPLHHQQTAICVETERAMTKHLQGGCQVPIGAFAEYQDDTVHLRGFVGEPDGSNIIRGDSSGSSVYHISVGIDVAKSLIKQGAGTILATLMHS